MAMDRDAAFAVIQRAFETFNADVGRARAGQAESEATIAAVEYEVNELRKLIAENVLPPAGAARKGQAIEAARRAGNAGQASQTIGSVSEARRKKAGAFG